MKVFKYKGFSPDGSEVNGIIEAYDEYEAVDQIREKCSIITSINPVKNAVPLWQRDFFASLKPRTLAMISSQFAIILRAGLPIVRSFELIADQAADRLMKRILTEVAQDVAAGHSVASSFESRGGKYLPATFIETVRAGEESGTLENSFEKLSKYYDKQSKTKGRVKAAFAYPVFLLILAVAVIIICMVVIVPTLTETFTELGIDLPTATKVLIAMSDFFSSFWWLILLVVAGSVIGLKYYAKTPKGRLNTSKWKLMLPLLGNVARMSDASQFANTLSTLLYAGLSLPRALEVTGKVIKNYVMSLEVDAAAVGVVAGKSVADGLLGSENFPKMLTEMTAVGEESGTLESTLDVIGEYYDNELDLTVSKALSILEPVIIVVMGLIVAFILISVYFPIFQMYGSM